MPSAYSYQQIDYCRYRTVVEEVPTEDYTISLGEARLARTGSDVTIVAWGQQVAVAERAVSRFICVQPHAVCMNACCRGLLAAYTQHRAWLALPMACPGTVLLLLIR